MSRPLVIHIAVSPFILKFLAKEIDNVFLLLHAFYYVGGYEIDENRIGDHLDYAIY